MRSNWINIQLYTNVNIYTHRQVLTYIHALETYICACSYKYVNKQIDKWTNKYT